MAKLRTGQKLERVLRFLYGLRDPRIARCLVEHGFSQAELDRGWALLRRAAGEHLRVDTGTHTPTVASMLAELDAWENLWFPVVRSALGQRYPEVAAELFRNLLQTRGPELLVSVDLFLRRLDAMASEGERGSLARALLRERGLGDEAVAEARALLARVRRVDANAQLPSGTVDAEHDEDPPPPSHEAELWRWYLEWSGIARATIREPLLLRRLGFRRENRRAQHHRSAGSRCASCAGV